MPSAENATAPRRLTLELGAASAAATLLGLGAGTQQWQFVGKVDDQPVFASATFAAPYSWGGIPVGKTMVPQEEWAPGMTRALDDLKREIKDDGWVEFTHGQQPWDLEYRKP